MKDANWPIFIAAPFMFPSASTILMPSPSGALELLVLAILAAATLAGPRAGVTGTARADHLGHLRGAADRPVGIFASLAIRPRL